MAENSVALDRIDREILGILQRDGRISWLQLGALVHLSPNAVAERVRRLQRAGVVRRFTVEIDQAAMGRTLDAIIDVRTDASGSLEAFEAAIQHRDDIQWAAHVTGAPDYKMRVSCAGTRGLDELLLWLRTNGAADTHTDVILRWVK